MAIRVIFDASRCQGYANCLIEAPQVWDFDEDRDVAVLLTEFPDDALVEQVKASVRGCPAQAITLDDAT